jgi:hypothetical protein
LLKERKAIAPLREIQSLLNSIAQQTLIITQSTRSNLSLQVGDCQKKILLPATDANAEVMEIPNPKSEKGDCSPREKQSPFNRNLDNRNHRGTQNMITILSLQETQSDDPREKILLPPTDPNAEVIQISGYKLVYVNGACPRNYRVYKADSMIGVIFQHITHWSNGVDSLRYPEPVDAAVGLDEFLKLARISTTAAEQPSTEEELLDKEFDSLTNDEWERLKRYVPEAKHLVAA